MAERRASVALDAGTRRWALLTAAACLLPLLLQLPDRSWVVAGVGSMAVRGQAGGWAVPAATIRRMEGEMKGTYTARPAR